MKKPIVMISIGGILLVAPAMFVIYSNSVYNTAQCIATFEGQNSLPCRTGGSLILSNLFSGVSLIGALIMIAAMVQLYRKL